MVNAAFMTALMAFGCSAAAEDPANARPTTTANEKVLVSCFMLVFPWFFNMFMADLQRCTTAKTCTSLGNPTKSHPAAR
ncbi:hypothetical protein D3C87_1888900 [compost metagenome]